MKTVGLLLANGRSVRFGKQNKLLTTLDDRPLVSYPANALRSFNADHLIAVTDSEKVATLLEGFEIIRPPANRPGQGDSISLGVERAQYIDAERVLILLGDMPFIDTALIVKVCHSASQNHPSCITDGIRKMVPACFPKPYFSRLIELQGDVGAAHLLNETPKARTIEAMPHLLKDIDTPEDLEQIYQER